MFHHVFFSTSQVRVVRFYVCLLAVLVLLVVLLRPCDCSVACRASTPIMYGQCCAPDLNRDAVRPVLRAGPQLPRSCEFSVAHRTSTAKCVGKECQKECQKICQKECQKICQKIFKKECQEICQKECQKICQKECREICQKECQKDMSERMSKDMSEGMSKDMSQRMSEDCFQSVCEVESNRRHLGDELYVYPHLTRSG